jgi:AcrR family transcriptional regulator
MQKLTRSSTFVKAISDRNVRMRMSCCQPRGARLDDARRAQAPRGIEFGADPTMPSRRPRSTGAAKPGPAPRDGGERIGARNERKILKAATAIFSRKGFDGTRIAEIADEAGLPKANVYYYFASKEAIYAAVIGRLLRGWDDALKHIAPEREPIEALEAYVRAKLDHARRNVEESRVFAAEILRGGRFLSRKDRSHMRAVTARHAGVVAHWAASGKIRPVDPRHLFILLWSATQFYADFETLACDALETRRLAARDWDAAARTIVATVLAGLTPARVTEGSGIIDIAEGAEGA